MPPKDPSTRLRLSRDDRLWHLKCRYFPKAVSQSLRIQLTLNSGKKMPVSKARTGVQSQNSACAEFWSFVPLQRETLFFLAKPGRKGGKRGNRQTVPRIRQSRILEFWNRAFAQDMSISMPKRSCRPNVSEWRHLTRLYHSTAGSCFQQVRSFLPCSIFSTVFPVLLLLSHP